MAPPMVNQKISAVLMNWNYHIVLSSEETRKSCLSDVWKNFHRRFSCVDTIPEYFGQVRIRWNHLLINLWCFHEKLLWHLFNLTTRRR